MILFDREEKVYIVAFVVSMITTFLVFSGCAKHHNSGVEEQVKADPHFVLERPLTAIAINQTVDFITVVEETEPERVEVLDCVLAELNGIAPKEAVVHVRNYVGEGCFDSYVSVYSMENPWNPRMMAFHPAGGGYLDGGYLSIVDVENDGIDEIAIGGDGDGEMLPRSLEVLNLVDGALVNRTPGLDCGTAYYFCDFDRDNMKEIVALRAYDTSKTGIPESYVFTVIEINKSGFTGETVVTADTELLILRSVLEDASVMREPDIKLLFNCVKPGGIEPEGLEVQFPAINK